MTTRCKERPPTHTILPEQTVDNKSNDVEQPSSSLYKKHSSKRLSLSCPTPSKSGLSLVGTPAHDNDGEDDGNTKAIGDFLSYDYFDEEALRRCIVKRCRRRSFLEGLREAFVVWTKDDNDDADVDVNNSTVAVSPATISSSSSSSSSPKQSKMLCWGHVFIFLVMLAWGVTWIWLR